MLIASYTKSGGSWLTWLLIEILHEPDFLCDQVDKKELDKIIPKTEVILKQTPDVHLIRHPLDVMCSMWNYALLTNRASPDQETQFYDLYLAKGRSPLASLNQTRWRDFVRWASSCKYQVKYDSLVNDPASELVKIVRKRQNVSKAVDKYSVEVLREREKSVDAKKIGRVTNKKYSFYNKADSFYYKEILTTEQIKQGQEVFGEELNKFWPETLET